MALAEIIDGPWSQNGKLVFWETVDRVVLWHQARGVFWREGLSGSSFNADSLLSLDQVSSGLQVLFLQPFF
jgi:hypothetical protein